VKNTPEHRSKRQLKNIEKFDWQSDQLIQRHVTSLPLLSLTCSLRFRFVRLVGWCWTFNKWTCNI